MKKVAFVMPWYGDDIPGGAESECRNLAKNINKRGYDVEILTTCVKEFASDWNVNYHKEGTYEESGLTVKRFNVNGRNTELFDEVNRKLISNIPISLSEERIFFNEMINSDDLINYIKDNKSSYQCYAYLPYMFGTTYAGVLACPEKAVLIPCLHNESYAYMQVIKKMFLAAKGLIFFAEPEFLLAKKIYGIDESNSFILGAGLNLEFESKKNSFKNNYKINNPYILYAGRKDKGKNVDLLIKYFAYYIKENPYTDLRLVLIGGGQVDIPRGLKDFVYDFGFLPEQDKYDAYADCTCLVQPSINESFSIVIMECWNTGRPVLVNAGCDVTKHYAIKSNGGLFFSDYNEFAECVEFFKHNERVASKMGALGRDYVNKNFSWDIIVKKYVDFFSRI